MIGKQRKKRNQEKEFMWHMSHVQGHVHGRGPQVETAMA